MNDQPQWPGMWMYEAAERPKKKPWAMAPPKLLASAAVFGVLFSYLFVKQGLGLNLTVAVLLVYAFAWYNRKLFVRRSFREEWLIYLFTVPAVFLAVYFFTADTLMNIFSPLVILLILFVQYLVISGNARYSWDQPGFFIDMIFGAVNRGVLALGLFSSGVFGRLFKERSSNKRGVLIGVGAGIVLLLVIVPLLALSDANVSGMLNGFFEKLEVGDFFLYIFIFYIGASLVTGPVASAKSEELSGERRARESAGRRPIPGVTTGVALSMISVVYVLFAAVQFPYFFMPYDTLDRVLGLTSSAYAVRGFGELLLITCINFVLIAVALRFTAQKDGRMPAYIKGLLTLLVVFNFVIMASSHLRMQCYEASYGYTVRRFLSHSFMILLLILNAVMLLRIYRSNVKTARLFLAAALCYFCVIVAVGPERCVAQANITRYENAVQAGEEGSIDTGYLFTLSASALPETCDFAEAYPDAFDESAREIARQRLDNLEARPDGWESANAALLNAGERLRQLLR